MAPVVPKTAGTNSTMLLMTLLYLLHFSRSRAAAATCACCRWPPLLPLATVGVYRRLVPGLDRGGGQEGVAEAKDD